MINASKPNRGSCHRRRNGASYSVRFVIFAGVLSTAGICAGALVQDASKANTSVQTKRPAEIRKAITVPQVNAETMKFWSFQPVKRPPIPTVRNMGWIRTPIDLFVLSKLESIGLTPAPPAGRAVLIRRATYDMTGLPPTPEEVKSFVSDTSPKAWEKVVDRLLASPHYGEKWGRHWLDLVRYAETNSYERDGIKPNAWRYRDYVIQSLNQDKPYNHF